MTGQSGDGEPKKKKKTTSLTSKILRGIGTRSSRKTMAWASSLASGEETLQLYQMIAESAESVDDFERSPNSMAGWVEKLFEAFQQYEVEFNRAVGSKSEIAVKTEPPHFNSHMKATGSDPGHFTGKIHTRDWALMIRGNQAFMEGYIIPCNQLIAFTGNTSRYHRYFKIDVNLSQGVRWRCDETEIFFADIRSLAKQLFTGFIKVAKGEREEKSPFKYLTGERLKAAAKLSAEISNPQGASSGTSNIFGDESDWLLKLSDPSGSSDTSVAQNQAPSSAPVGQVQASISNPAPSLMQANAANSPPQAAANPAPGQPKAQQASVQQTPAFEQACLVLVKALDYEIQSLSAQSTKAFQRDEIELANRAMKRATKMIKLKEQIVNSVYSWRQEFQSED